MSISRRPFARAGALAAAAAVLAACGDSTSPLNLEPEDFVVVGEDIALQIEQSALSLTAAGAMQTPDQPPIFFSLGSSTSQRMLDGPVYALSRVQPPRRPTLQIGDQECGDPSQEVPVDSDEDGVPDNYSVTFRLPACRFELEGGIMEMTGRFSISDPFPGTAGHTLTFGMDDFRLAIDGEETDLTFTQNGTETVSGSTNDLSQTMDWSQVGVVSGYGSFGMSLDWTNTFVASTPGSIQVGEPLPSGQFSPNGTVRYSQGKRVAALVVETVEPLEDDAACAADYAEGLVDSPFAGGVVDVAFSGDEGRGYVRISYAECSWADVVFIGAND